MGVGEVGDVGEGGQEFAGVDSAEVVGVADVLDEACWPDSVRSDWDG